MSGNADSIGTAVIGAGPAGLTAAYVLARAGAPGAVFEADEVVGGLARTLERDGYRFDLGGHRFYTKVEPIARLWKSMLGDEYLTRPRLSRIYYQGRFFAYPLAVRDVVRKLGVVEAARCALSYAASRLRRHRNPETFEQWVTGRFGRRLYSKFFGPYTEKVWGAPGSQIRAEWAAQRIQNFSLAVAVLSLLGLRRRHVTTLIERFHYPRLGPGQMWEAFADWAADRDFPVHTGHRCASIRHAGERITSVAFAGRGEVAVDGIVSSMPLGELVRALDPPAPPDVLAAADRLRHRHLCVVALMLRGEQPFPDNWIYLHDPNVRAGRVQNFGAWSESMVPHGTCLGVEYFCFEDDDIWRMPEPEAVRFATAELASAGLVDPALVTGGVKIPVANAYPMYLHGSERAVERIRSYLAGFENLETCGRSGLHRYNNQDHSMLTGAYAAANLLNGASHDVWSVNADAEYLEEGPLTQLELDLEPVA